MKRKTTNKYLIVALLVAIVFHGSAIFFTLESTYDAYIHIFFGSHYAQNWFETWNYNWYTGFTVLGYPPLVHQCIALLSYIAGLKFGLFVTAILATILFIKGVYKYALLLTSNKIVAGYTAIIAVFSSSFIETLHLFGQLPSIIGIALLMHALPEIYFWIKTRSYRYLATSLSLIAVTVTSHHVTSIFGMIFFIFPVIGLALMDLTASETTSKGLITFRSFFKTFLKNIKPIIVFGLTSLFLIIFCILPYWINTKNNPITQVPIPHGSRDNFFEVLSSGLVFFIIPWGILLFILPYIWYRFFSKRYFFFGLSFTLLTILGTGGTTPIPKLILGENAFNILTLDRFTLWASIMALPIFGEFIYRFIEGDLRIIIRKKLGVIYHHTLGILLVGAFLGIAIFSMSLGYFRPSQPQPIKMLPILNFLKQDQHDHWRYLPLGFGDQMAWLSAQTQAMTVDGNYHSGRRIPELTTRAVERLENSKYRGIEGIGSLQQFLTVPEKYHLKYIFSNDKFYDPILFFCGWQRLQQLENGIMVWEKLNIPPLPTILPKEEVPFYQKIFWGIIPIGVTVIAFWLNIIMKLKNFSWYPHQNTTLTSTRIPYILFNEKLLKLSLIWGWGLCLVFLLWGYNIYIRSADQISPNNVAIAYYDALDFKEFKTAYSYLDPQSNKTLDQFMVEVSVTDGLLNSYAKLDKVTANITHQNDSIAHAEVLTYWITPLEKIEKTFYHTLTKRGRKWYLKPPVYNLDIPPDQLFEQTTTLFYNHGRRKISSEQTYHEDVLKQPVLEVISASLLQHNDQYVIVGNIQNVDNVPADIVVNGTLFNDNNQALASYSAKHTIKHKLLPKETSSFRIDFEGIAWLDIKNVKPTTFDPDHFTPISLQEQPVLFNLLCAGNVATTDLHKTVAINDLDIQGTTINGVLFNYGLEEVTIPQLLISYYNTEKELIWVDYHYIKEGIRPQRKQYFEYSMPDISTLKFIDNKLDHVFVNGLPNKEISSKYVPNRKTDDFANNLIPVTGNCFSYISIEINNFVGNPRL